MWLRRIIAIHLTLLSAALPAASPAVADATAGAGKLTLDSRLRMEHVDDDAAAAKARALTWRNRIGYRSAPWQGITLFAEIEDIRALNDHYNSTANGRTRYATVADPEGSEWNQAYLSWDSGQGTQLVAGRQRIVFDNQRFFGNVGWRQNEQTFDALSASQAFGDRLKLRYAYLAEAKRVFGDHHPNPQLAGYDLDAHLLNLAHATAWGNLSGYGYFVANQDLPLTSTRTLGVRFAGARALNESWKLVYTAEHAEQDNWRNAPAAIDAHYSLLELGATYGAYSAKLSHERLSGDGASAFQTPFATLHAFNGWADRFLTTPADGLVDTYLSAAGPVGPAQWAIIYHDYQADRGGRDYGDEWNAQLSYPFKERFTALLKWADYRSAGFARDSQKLWLSIEYRY